MSPQFWGPTAASVLELLPGASATCPLSPTPWLEVTAPCPSCGCLGGRGDLSCGTGPQEQGKGKGAAQREKSPSAPKQQHTDM